MYKLFRIGRCLNKRKNNRSNDSHQNARKKKTTCLLVSFAVVFFFSWAPLCILNITLDILKLMVRLKKFDADKHDDKISAYRTPTNFPIHP